MHWCFISWCDTWLARNVVELHAYGCPLAAARPRQPSAPHTAWWCRSPAGCALLAPTAPHSRCPAHSAGHWPCHTVHVGPQPALAPYPSHPLTAPVLLPAHNLPTQRHRSAAQTRGSQPTPKTPGIPRPEPVPALAHSVRTSSKVTLPAAARPAQLSQPASDGLHPLAPDAEAHNSAAPKPCEHGASSARNTLLKCTPSQSDPHGMGLMTA